MSWILATLLAAAAQTARNAMQSSLTATLGTLGATQVRFLYGLPFALLFLVAAATADAGPIPGPSARFLLFTGGGAVAQILATAMLLAAMHRGSFSLATVLSKTEAVQIAVFGSFILGDTVTPARALAICTATLGVVLVALKRGGTARTTSAAAVLLGIGSGAGFALAAVGFRGGILALPAGGYWLRATTTLVWSLGLQTLLLGTWMLLRAPGALQQSLRLWRPSLLAGFFGAFASQFWFLGFSLTGAANVRTLGLVEVLFAWAAGRWMFRQVLPRREALGMALILAGVVWLLASA